MSPSGIGGGTETRTPPDKRCGCNTAASETSVLCVDDEVISECVGCGAVWALADGTPPDYIGYLLRLLLESGAGMVEWSTMFAVKVPKESSVPPCPFSLESDESPK